MENSIELYGRVSKSGKPHISNMDKFNELFKMYSGKRFTMEITILEPDTIIHHVWFIIKMIVPAFIMGHLDKGTILSPPEALEEILNACEIFYKTEHERHNLFNWKTYQPECDMSAFQLECAIEWLNKYCIKHFNIVIGNTKII